VVRFHLSPSQFQVLPLIHLIHQRVDLPCPCRVEPVRESPRSMPEGFFPYGTVPCHRPYSLASSFFPTPLPTDFPRSPNGPALAGSRRFRGACGTIRSSDCLPRIVPRFALRLSRPLSRCPTGTRQALLGSRSDLPCRAVRTHLGATGEWMRLRLHNADSTLPRLWPTGSSSGSPPLTTAQQFSSCPSDSASRRTPCPPRLVSGPARHYPRSLGYGSLHLRTRGTSTLPIRALPSAHYGLG